MIPLERDHKELTVWIHYTTEVDIKYKNRNRPQKVEPDLFFKYNNMSLVTSSDPKSNIDFDCGFFFITPI